MDKKLYIASAALLTLAACDYNDKYFDGLDEMVAESQKVVTSVDYTLTEADYSTISKYSPVDAADAAELSGLAKAQSFSSTDFAARYIPKFLASKYPTVDNASAVNVAYNLSKDAPEYLAQIAAAAKYELTEADYAEAWGSDDAVSYLTPRTISKLPSLISANVEAENDGLAMITYKYSETEPQTSTNETASSWTKLTVNNLPEGTSWNYVSSNADLSAYAGKKIRIGVRYLSTSEVAGTIELESAHVGEATEGRSDLYMYKANEDGTYSLATKFAAGTYFIAGKDADGNLVPFAKPKDTSKTYGYFGIETPIAAAEKLSAEVVAPYLVEITAAESGIGNTIKNADGNYIFMKGTYNNFNLAAEIPEDGNGQWVFAYKGEGCISIANTANSKIVKFDAEYGNIGAYAGEYFANHLCSESTDAPEGLSFVDVTLPDGVSYIWSATKAYGLKATAYVNNASYESESWFVTNEIDLSEATAPVLTFECAANKFSGSAVSDFFEVYVSEDYEDGQEINVSGNKSLKAASAETKYALYKYNGSSWSAYTSGVIVLNPSDYTAMGLKYANFSATDKAEVYIPKFLATNKPYALEEDVVAVVYNYYDATSKVTSLSADEYNFIDGAWSKTSTSDVVTSQFVKTNGAFVFDPSVVINLPKASTSAYFYQACTDWVWENIDTPLGFTAKGQGYVTSYANNEYYTGSTAYQNNVDWRVAKAREQYAAGYEGLSDDEALALMQDHLKEAWAATLSILYPDAKPIEGIDITYTINFIVYGLDQTDWTVVFKLVDVGQFEYVEESLQSVE